MLEKLVEIVRILRAPGGCPWDRQQTYLSLRPHIIEEAYELLDAMEREDMEDLREELGDVLLHVVMLSQMADERGCFSVQDVIKDVSEKMRRRHPHVFGQKTAETVEDVWKNWEAVKSEEKKDIGIFDSIPKSLPSLMRALKIQKRVARKGFDWEGTDPPFEKLEEEVNELKEVVSIGDENAIEDELGDVLFSWVNVARKIGVDPEIALSSAIKKFTRRFEVMDKTLKQENVVLKDLDAESMERAWQSAKKKSDPV